MLLRMLYAINFLLIKKARLAWGFVDEQIITLRGSRSQKREDVCFFHWKCALLDVW